jgi:hypothetical protein
MTACSEQELMQVGTTVPSTLRTKAKTFQISTCADCQQHWRQTNRYTRVESRLSGLLFIAVLAISINAYRMIQNLGFWRAMVSTIVILAIFMFFYWLIKLPFKPKAIQAPGHVPADLEPVSINYELSKGREVLNFTFQNDQYADQFRELNQLEDKRPQMTTVESARSVLTEATVRSIYQRYKEKFPGTNLNCTPDIPEKKLQNIRQKYPESIQKEIILLVFDDTVMGSAKVGLAITDQGMYARNGLGGGTHFIPLREIKEIGINNESNAIMINHQDFFHPTTLKEAQTKILFDLIQDLLKQS